MISVTQPSDEQGEGDVRGVSCDVPCLMLAYFMKCKWSASGPHADMDGWNNRHLQFQQITMTAMLSDPSQAYIALLY